ncbi:MULTISPECIES: electron transfer flavoprotein subunit alpha/FixB family protein [unclassified Luteococcus]|uniref:electron transfer flavoprotein subunit alpha/FixB family protein n=1 Tax=unclassified Luteococcus TaxID=2639923 RepID=UPI00313DC38F
MLLSSPPSSRLSEGKNMDNIWIVNHDMQRGNGLASAVRSLSATVNAISVGAGPLSSADLTLMMDVDGSVPAESYAGSVADALAARGAQCIVFQDGTQDRLLAGLVAARLGVSAVVAAELPTEPSTVNRLAHGGLAIATEQVVAETTVLVVSSLPAIEQPSAGVGATEALAGTPLQGVRIIEERPTAGSTVDLGAARRVVGVGRGFASQDDLALAQGVADKLGAELACTRPIAEGVGWMPPERYLGVSGAAIKPDLYLAIGLSGQVQHMVGVNQSKVIVAINKDKNAPIFSHVDFGIVGDLYQVLPELAKQL